MPGKKSSSTSKPTVAREQTSTRFDGADLFSLDRPSGAVCSEGPATDTPRYEEGPRNTYADASQPAVQRRIGSGPADAVSRSRAVHTEMESGVGRSEDGLGELPSMPGEPKPGPTVEGAAEKATKHCLAVQVCPICRPLMSVGAVASYFDVSVATIWRWRKTVRGFPHPESYGPGTTRWDRREIEAYHRSRLKDRAR